MTLRDENSSSKTLIRHEEKLHMADDTQNRLICVSRKQHGIEEKKEFYSKLDCWLRKLPEVERESA